MSDFSDLQKKAALLPTSLTACYTKRDSWSSFFCSCLPTNLFAIPDKRMAPDAQLIKLTAHTLDYYVSSHEKKWLILVGMYLFVWQGYESAFEQLTNKPFLDILSEHVKFATLKECEQALGIESLNALDEFCLWVERNQTYLDIQNLFHAFPVDMQARIFAQREHYTNPLGHEVKTGFSW